MITDEQVRQFLEDGAVTIDTPLTAAQVAAASAALDRLLPFSEPGPGQSPRYRASLTCSYDEPALLDIIQHPFFEEVAKRVLQAEEVLFFQTAITAAYPQPNTPFSFDQHVDIQYCLSDFRATPRRIICSYFLWLTDVNEKRAPMMVRPGSHLLIAEEREADPERKGVVPQVMGVSMDHLTAHDYADAIPLTATAGQVSVLTTATVHGASVNVDSEARKVLVITFTAAGVEIGLPPAQEAQRVAYNEELRTRLRPERAHILPA
jgi:ectoine hydroxylase-related dioxygenase (phytanoyl-CoA dioxygenase family)